MHVGNVHVANADLIKPCTIRKCALRELHSGRTVVLVVVRNTSNEQFASRADAGSCINFTYVDGDEFSGTRDVVVPLDRDRGPDHQRLLFIILFKHRS